MTLFIWNQCIHIAAKMFAEIIHKRKIIKENKNRMKIWDYNKLWSLFSAGIEKYKTF